MLLLRIDAWFDWSNKTLQLFCSKFLSILKSLLPLLSNHHYAWNHHKSNDSANEHDSPETLRYVAEVVISGLHQLLAQLSSPALVLLIQSQSLALSSRKLFFLACLRENLLTHTLLDLPVILPSYCCEKPSSVGEMRFNICRLNYQWDDFFTRWICCSVLLCQKVIVPNSCFCHLKLNNCFVLFCIFN